MNFASSFKICTRFSNVWFCQVWFISFIDGKLVVTLGCGGIPKSRMTLLNMNCTMGPLGVFLISLEYWCKCAQNTITWYSASNSKKVFLNSMFFTGLRSPLNKCQQRSVTGITGWWVKSILYFDFDLGSSLLRKSIMLVSGSPSSLLKNCSRINSWMSSFTL